MTNGYNNRLARINLSSNQITTEPLPDIAETFIGGKGLGAYILTRELAAKVDPLSPENKLIIVTGPLQGSIVPICGRYAVVTKSPLTGLILDSHAGGSIGPELKFAGYDALIIEGAANEPCYISILNDQIEIRNGEHLKGLPTLEKEIQIKKDLEDEEVKVMSIGVAGENMVKIACITNESFRNVGRGGAGAVFGSKKLLAIAIKGTVKDIPVADSEALNELASQLRSRATQGRTSGLRIYRIGTPNLVTVASNRDQLPVRNFQEGTIENPALLEEEAINHYTTKKKPCYKCVISCSHILNDDFSYAKEGHIVAVPEYETLALFGSNCGVDFETVIEANYLANMLSLDTISTGNVIAWFMECSEKNLVPKKYKSDKISFGDSKGLLNLIHKIANKQGVGEILAEGTKYASEIFGQETEQFAINVKGLEMAAWDPRGRLALGLSYATAAVGASHLRGWPNSTKTPLEEPITSEIVKSLVEGQDLKIIKDSLIICHFTHSIIPAMNLDDGQALYSAVTGSQADVREITQNIWSLTRYFNMREFEEQARKYDKLPSRLLNEPLPSGSAEGSKAFQSDFDFQHGLSLLYQMRRCQENGDLTIEETQRIEELLK
ncbi:MAG: aldehyde ferredoxin oxidoreductase family protein [Candidatus Heimdallarchaeota archaeon]|nr:MAG: aldehyde ferredoxin oxidoreductase family protein [Candidatus Heimdallarchaeota archaeon]